MIYVGDRAFKSVHIHTPNGSVIKVWPESAAVKLKERIEQEHNAQLRSWAGAEERRRKFTSRAGDPYFECRSTSNWPLIG